jgi:hypothetical protein
MVYFYEKRDFVCPACGVTLGWETRRVFTEHGDRMSLVHPETVIDALNPCPHSGKRFYAPGLEFTEIK